MTRRRATAMMRLGWCGTVLLGAVVLPRTVVWATCSLTPSETDRPNIILIVADNLGWVELPYFSPPINWGPSATPVATNEYRLIRPDLNRLAARMMAKPDGTAGQFSAPPLIPGDPTPTPYAVRPYAAAHPGYSDVGTQSCECDNTGSCQLTNASGCKYFKDPAGPSPAPTAAPNSVKSRTDVLRGFGGLQQLINSGVRFDRFYVPTSDCESSRASILTGRHVERHGVTSNGSPYLPPHEITIAEYLKQGCRGNRLDCPGPAGQVQNCPCFLNAPAPGVDCTLPQSGPCYTTGLIGKWHNGEEEGVRPWNQGFDEVITHPKDRRGPFVTSAWQCKARSDAAPCCNGLGRYLGPAGPTPTPGCGTKPDPYCCMPLQNGFGEEVLSPKAIADGDNDNCTDNIDAAREEGEPDPGKGCRFSTRLYRDFAKNFITRHKDDKYSDGTAKPFFLMLTLNAMHLSPALDAPNRTENHYPKPWDPTFWASLEEIDAAVGQILQTVKDTGIGQNTVVLFTADNGNQLPNDHGSPTLRAYYTTLWEAGIRVGLVGTACGVAPTPGPSAMDVSGHLASHVDIFSTIAEAARAPLPPTRVLQSCQGSGQACTSCLPGDPCLNHYVDGTSFYSLLLTGAQVPTPTPARDFTYAKYSGEQTIISRAGVFAAPPGQTPTPGGRVCAYAAFNTANVPIRGASCDTCANDTECSQAPQKLCAVLGRVCVPSGGGTCPPPGSGSCNGDARNTSGPLCAKCTYAPPPGGFTRCNGKMVCPAGLTCSYVHTPCNRCAPAAWKFKGTNDLYDLTSNPEEDIGANCSGLFPGISGALQGRLAAWNSCSKSESCETVNCEPKKLTDPLPPSSCP